MLLIFIFMVSCLVLQWSPGKCCDMTLSPYLSTTAFPTFLQSCPCMMGMACTRLEQLLLRIQHCWSLLVLEDIDDWSNAVLSLSLFVQAIKCLSLDLCCLESASLMTASEFLSVHNNYPNTWYRLPVPFFVYDTSDEWPMWCPLVYGWFFFYFFLFFFIFFNLIAL